MRVSFKEFVDKKSQICEGYKDSDLEKVFKLITKSLNKHLTNHVVALYGMENTKVDDEYMRTKYFMYNINNQNRLVGLNFLRTSNSNEVYSIDFFNNYDILFSDKPVKTKLSIYTLGSSIVYFLPVIWYVLDSADYNVKLEDIRKLGKEIFVKECKSFEFSVGALKYYIINNLNNSLIKDSFMLETKTIDNARDFAKMKDRERAEAYSKRSSSKEAAETYKKLLAEVKEIWAAVKGGATTLPELKAAIKNNVTVVAEIDEIMKDQQAELDKEHEDPEMVFKKMRKYIKMVIKGINPSVILCGAPGVGKTYNVMQQLKAAGYREGTNLYTIKGRCSPRTLYMAMYQYRAKGDIIVIDDADTLVGPRAPEDCINILKGALDSTSDDQGRLVMYGVAGRLLDDDGDPIPKKMFYNGSIIIITNYNAGALDTALRGRSFVQDIKFTTDDLLKIVKRIMPAIDPEHLSSRAKIKAFDYLQEMANKKMDMEISIRTFGICAKIFETCADDPDFTEDEARQMIAEQMKLQSRRASRNAKY